MKTPIRGLRLNVTPALTCSIRQIGRIRLRQSSTQRNGNPIAIKLDRAIQIGHRENHDGRFHLPEGSESEKRKRCKLREGHNQILGRRGENFFSNLAKLSGYPGMEPRQ